MLRAQEESILSPLCGSRALELRGLVASGRTLNSSLFKVPPALSSNKHHKWHLAFPECHVISLLSLWLEINKPPVAKITGNVVVTLPTSTAELDGSRSSDDKGIVSYLWTRDEGSPAAGVSGSGAGALFKVNVGGR